MIELVVVIAILALVIVTASDLFLSMIKTQKKILAEQEVLNQVSYAIEYMARAIRMARADEFNTCVGQGESYGVYSNGIKFINHSSEDICQVFLWDSVDKVLKESRDGGQTYIPITSRDVIINSFTIKTYGEEMRDGLQARIVLVLDFQYRDSNISPARKIIQTTISQRNMGS